MEKVERVKTGIPGFDSIINGGIPKNNLVVISGDPGSGKTIMCTQFLYQGAIKYNEPGIYVSLEESEEELIQTTGIFGWDFKDLIKKKMLEIITIELYDFNQLKDTIEDAITRLKAKRIVIDPGVVFQLYFKRELEARKSILSLGRMLKKSGCTAIITNESLDKASTLFGLEEYVADGVVLLFHKQMKDRFVRSIAILKMRDTKISEKFSPMSITQKGIRVLSKQEVYDEI